MQQSYYQHASIITIHSNLYGPRLEPSLNLLKKCARGNIDCTSHSYRLTPTETGLAQVVGHLQLYQANA